MNIFANEGAILHQDALSFHLSHQPPLYVSIHFLLHELVQLVLILLCKIKSTRTQVVDGSNESLEHSDEDLDTLLQKYSPLQKIFKMGNVQIVHSQTLALVIVTVVSSKTSKNLGFFSVNMFQKSKKCHNVNPIEGAQIHKARFFVGNEK